MPDLEGDSSDDEDDDANEDADPLELDVEALAKNTKWAAGFFPNITLEGSLCGMCFFVQCAFL